MHMGRGQRRACSTTARRYSTANLGPALVDGQSCGEYLKRPAPYVDATCPQLTASYTNLPFSTVSNHCQLYLQVAGRSIVLCTQSRKDERSQVQEGASIRPGASTSRGIPEAESSARS